MAHCAIFIMELNKLTKKEIADFTHQLAIILHAGISPYEGMAILKDDTSVKLRPLYTNIYNELDQGNDLTQSLKATNAFPSYLINVVSLGESAGRLEEVMNSLSNYYQRLYNIEENITTAVSYPLIMIILMFVIVVVLLTQVLPIFNRVFVSLGTSVSGFSLYLLNFGKTLTAYSWVFIIILALMVILFIMVRYTEKGRERFQRFLIKAPFSKNIALKIALAKFSDGMSIALSSGMDTNEAFDMAKELVDHKVLKARISQAEEIMKEKDLSEGLIEAHVLTGIDAQLIKLGYRTGGVDSIFREIANRYDAETSEALTRAIGIIEPTLVAILAIITGFVLLSVMLPLIGVMGSL